MPTYTEAGSGGVQSAGTVVLRSFYILRGRGGAELGGTPPFTRSIFGTGSVQIRAFSEFEIRFNYQLLYAVNSIVYIRPKALRGILERVCIKKVFCPPFPKQIFSQRMNCRMCFERPLYVDTYNAFHNEQDLCDYDTAVFLADAYLDLQEALLEVSL